ncbi:Major latex protein domain containing protein [Parasponia andersonii]|uniref:Major latex protein domain containing protein n=1 Tax=Parasponia andersonii TaxID=3476 RepID=A0A2P5DWA0_PARAD|nr:Major latex protein domain containing protein [Parasponia andersonii]
MISGQLSHELEVKVPASQVWELYGTLRLAKLVEEQLSSTIQKIDLVEGDGGVGTILHLIFVPGAASYSDYKEKFTKVDNENRVKEAEVVEGGYLELGFSLYRVRLEIIEKDDHSSIIKSTIEYELNDDSAANASIVSVDSLAAISLIAQNHLTNTKL